MFFGLCLAVALLVSWRVGRWFAGGLSISNSPSGMTSSGGGKLYEEISVKSMTTFIFFWLLLVPLIWVFYFSVGNGKNDWCSQKSQRSSKYCKDTKYYIDPNVPYDPDKAAQEYIDSLGTTP
jgi:hypothetical protein